jgi:hypothetical protein
MAGWKMPWRDDPTTKPGNRETEEKNTMEERAASTVWHFSEGKPLVFIQVNCRSICIESLECWYFIDSYNPDVIGTESWLSEEINSAEIFRDDHITFRRDRRSLGGGIFTCVKNYRLQ